MLAPIEILGIQSSFSSLFSVSHNDGTWFVSCILMCYLLYPLIQGILKQISLKAKIMIIAIACFILLYSPIVVFIFSISSIYSNPFFRVIEFLIGATMCSLIPDVKNSRCIGILYSYSAVVLEFAVLVIGVSIAVNNEFHTGDYMMYSLFGLPVFMLQLLSFYGLRVPIIIEKSRLLHYACDVSYAFFLAQFFAWDITMVVINMIGNDSNVVKILISFMICLICAVLLHEIIEKPMKRMLNNRLARKA